MTPQTEILSTTTPQRTDHGWIIEMPKEIAEAFGVPPGLIVTLYPQPGSISAEMDLTAQTSEARGREPGWFIELPPGMATVVGAADNTFIGIYAKQGGLYVEILPPLPSDFERIVQDIIEEDRELFEELKRLGD
ncbi:MAG: hypothetical protein ACRD9Y_12875 [Blastocatellia bacterium]